MSAIIGRVYLTDCTWGTHAESPWAERGKWHWWLAEPVLLETPIVCTGRLSLWRVPQELWQYLDEEGQAWLRQR